LRGKTVQNNRKAEIRWVTGDRSRVTEEAFVY
jgi:hypothetical protein